MSCPENTMPELRPLPAMTKDHLRLLTEVLKQVPSELILASMYSYASTV